MAITKNKTIRLLLSLYTLLVLVAFAGFATTVFGNAEDAQAQAGITCTTASECYGLPCEYPAATYCTYGEVAGATSGTCVCRNWNDQPAWNNGCASDPYSEPPACPSGWEDCGTSAGHAGDAGCVRFDNLVAQGRCAGCNNPSNIYRWCREVIVTPPPGCYEFCTNDSGCGPGLVCDYSRGQICVNPEWPDEPDCTPPEGPVPFCGDAICDSGEACERISGDANTFRICESVGGAPTGAVVSHCRNISNTPGEPQPNQCTFCGDGIRQDIEECDYAIDDNCNSVCMRQDLTEGVTIDKTVINEQSPYFVGDQVRFAVRVTNTGQTTFNTVEFRDNWDPTYLRFIGGSVVKSTGEQIDDINPLIDSQTSNEFVINDVTDSVLGDLGPDEYYQFELIYTAIAPTPVNAPETCNYAITQPDDLPEIDDEDCVDINNRDTDL